MADNAQIPDDDKRRAESASFELHRLVSAGRAIAGVLADGLSDFDWKEGVPASGPTDPTTTKSPDMLIALADAGVFVGELADKKLAELDEALWSAFHSQAKDADE